MSWSRKQAKRLGISQSAVYAMQERIAKSCVGPPIFAILQIALKAFHFKLLCSPSAIPGGNMIKQENSPGIPLPRGWPQSVKSAMLHVISLAQFGLAYSRGWAVNSPIARMWLKAENEQLRQQVALLNEEIRIKDGTTSIAHTTLEGKTPRPRPRCRSKFSLTASSEIQRILVGRIKTPYAVRLAFLERFDRFSPSIAQFDRQRSRVVSKYSNARKCFPFSALRSVASAW